MAGEKKILISSYISNGLLQCAEPDYIILNGAGPQAEKEIRLTSPLNTLIITSMPATSYSRLQGILKHERIDSIHYIKKSGAFRTSL